jgi:hypothetical protein
MDNNRRNENTTQEQDELLREGRREEESLSPFEQARQKLADTNALGDEAEAEQQHKEAMTERD